MSTFKYIIVGAGAAGLHLTLAMLRQNLLKSNEKLLIIEPGLKKQNDKTWCFWEKEQGNWNQILTKSWNRGRVTAKNEAIDFNLNQYRYKMLNSIDFYEFAKTKIELEPNIHWLKDEVIELSESANGQVEVITKTYTFSSQLVFDSRITKDFFSPNKYYKINQHFKGWFIETENHFFNPERFTMMDFSIKDGQSTSFTYILPISTTKALVEFTYFTPNLVDNHIYDQFLNKYLEHKNAPKYKIISVEQGNIPMTNFPFEQYSTDSIIKIGTAGGWVKASTGYAFKNCERQADHIVRKLLNRQKLTTSSSSKYKHYDKLFLDVLSHQNNFGEMLFYKMYKRNKIETIFKFLDEKSNLLEDFSIISNLTSTPFIKAFGKHILSGFKLK
ncbi:lycopene cyclase family protein [Psychroflexus sp. ALD_RP9]|uniref:lycopene cyclase family protein n=1 Tax=Psychroflexus sp. ALD_RP9 TaxID=2777186 RepID=UPI001A8CD74D|nr:lycopene cyclase family protein [Psychroflexus sp. ALD_RP9]QSS97575.1 lycopene cyclase [Psychroflexus sp. ALD_RP9]